MSTGQIRIPSRTRALTVSYWLALGIIALLIIVGQIILQSTQQRIQQVFDAVNVAGRDNMYSQRLSKAALMLEVAQTEEELRAANAELETALQTWTALHQRSLDTLPNLPLPAEFSRNLALDFQRLAPHFEAMVQGAECLRALTSAFRSIESSQCPENQRFYRDLIFANENAYLIGMDRVAFSYTRGAEADYAQVRVTELIIAGIILMGLLLMGLLILRPAVERIRKIINQLVRTESELKHLNETLEQRVHQRTQDLERANDELIGANEDILSFTSIVSHDLRSPIVSARSFLSEIREDLKGYVRLVASLDPQQLTKRERAKIESSLNESLDSLDISVSQMERLSKGVLTISREKRRELSPSPVQTHKLVEAIVASMRPQIEAKNAQVRITTPLPDIVADPLTTEQIFSNLLGNALKYLENTRRGDVRIYAEVDTHRFTFYISDNGRGIREQDYEKIFKPFRRVGDNQNIEGEGLGLYGVRQMVKRQGGDIRFTSKLNTGTTFAFSIPRNIVPQETELNDTARIPSQSAV
jgi:signal transduction histidine kinase